MVDRGDSKKRTLTNRLTRDERDAIDQANELGANRSDFITETAYQEAQHVFLDRTVFTLKPEQFTRFQTFLDSPPEPSDQPRKLPTSKIPWE